MKGQISQFSDLALRLSHTATVRLTDKLEASGLVTRETGEDRRSVALHLTKAGKLRARKVVAERNEVLTEIIEALAPRQREQLEAVAEALLLAMTHSADVADHICRLCYDHACPPDDCPVHQAALKLDRTASKAS